MSIMWLTACLHYALFACVFAFDQNGGKRSSQIWNYRESEPLFAYLYFCLYIEQRL